MLLFMDGVMVFSGLKWLEREVRIIQNYNLL